MVPFLATRLRSGPDEGSKSTADVAMQWATASVRSLASGTNADLFSDRGDPMDARVPIEFGLVDEPPRYRTRFMPDGTIRRVEVPDHEWMWERGGSPRAAVRKPAFHEKRPSEDVIERGREARRACNRRLRLKQAQVRF